MPRFLHRFVARGIDLYREPRRFKRNFRYSLPENCRLAQQNRSKFEETVPRGRKRVNHCHFRGVISTAGIPFLVDHTCVQLHLRPPRKHRDRFTAVISLCRCSDSLPVSRRFFPESHGDRTFSTRQLERFLRNLTRSSRGRNRKVSAGEQSKGGKYATSGRTRFETDRRLRVKDTFVWVA